jgi:hypothetical protein
MSTFVKDAMTANVIWVKQGTPFTAEDLMPSPAARRSHRPVCRVSPSSRCA